MQEQKTKAQDMNGKEKKLETGKLRISLCYEKK